MTRALGSPNIPRTEGVLLARTRRSTTTGNNSMRWWVRVLCVSWAFSLCACSGGRGTPPAPSPTGPSGPIGPAEPACGMQSFPDPPLFSICSRPVARQCPLTPGPDARAVYSAGSCTARAGEACTPQPFPYCFSEQFSAVVSFNPPAEGLCGPEVKLSLTGGRAQWTLLEFAPVEGRCRLSSTADGERELLPCCRTLVDLPLQQAPGTTLRLSFDRDWALR